MNIRFILFHVLGYTPVVFHGNGTPFVDEKKSIEVRGRTADLKEALAEEEVGQFFFLMGNPQVTTGFNTNVV